MNYKTVVFVASSNLQSHKRNHMHTFLFEKEIQTFREASKAGASMQKENGGSK